MSPVVIRLAAVSAIVSLCFLGACTNGSVEDGTSSLSLVQEDYSATTNSSGIAKISFVPAAGATSVQLVASSSSGTIRLVGLKNSSGNSVLSDSSEITGDSAGSTASPHCTTLPYTYGGVSADTFTAEYAVYNNESAAAGVAVRLSVLNKSDIDPSSGTLKVNLVLVGPAAGNSSVRDALEQAFKYWKETYDRVGISLDPVWYEFDGSSTLPDPRSGSSLYETIAASTRPDAVNVVFGEQVSGLSGNYNKFGLSPLNGPAIPSPKSAVALSILAMTGSDGQFDLDEEDSGSVSVHNSETRLASEEMARLTARYLGLENIVDFSNSKVTSTDHLSDTNSCMTVVDCRYQEDSRTNVMFPFPLSKANEKNDEGHTEYYARSRFTDQQRDVLNTSVLVD